MKELKIFNLQSASRSSRIRGGWRSFRRAFVLESLSYIFAPIRRKEAIRIEARLLNELRAANLSNLSKKLIKGH
jgi:hypothetical protein